MHYDYDHHAYAAAYISWPLGSAHLERGANGGKRLVASQQFQPVKSSLNCRAATAPAAWQACRPGRARRTSSITALLSSRKSQTKGEGRTSRSPHFTR